ncbi:MAG: glycosyltransferase [Gammaproteobacteria bacterium]|nr:glycosyltransferase [Gammaproteobacteria bacterium]
MALKVLFIGNYDIPVHNIRPEAEMIIGLKARGVDVEVMTQGRCWYAGRMREAGIVVHDYVPPAKLSASAVRTIRACLRRGRHDILHLFNNKAIANGNLAAIGLPVKVVTYRGQTGNISRFDPSCYLTHLSPCVDRIVCVSNAVRDDLLRQVYDRRKPVTIYKGHDIGWYTGVQALSRADLGVPADAFLVGCVANNRPRKGVPMLMEAARTLGTAVPVHFVLAGHGMEAGILMPLLDGHPVGARCHFLGHREDALELVAACDATVLPATKREGLPKTVIESMALGVAPIVTRTGGSPELVVDGESGLVVPPGDAAALAAAITRLAEHRVQARAMGGAARARIASRFRLVDSIDQHLALYRELLAG